MTNITRSPHLVSAQDELLQIFGRLSPLFSFPAPSRAARRHPRRRPPSDSLTIKGCFNSYPMTSTATDLPESPTPVTLPVEASAVPEQDGLTAPEVSNDTAPDAEAAAVADAQDEAPDAAVTPKLSRQAQLQAQAQAVQPVLEKLFELYPQLFGAQFLPLKLGIFQELLARHPDDFQKDTLKLALGQHTRSTRYLQCVAAGLQRHDLDGQPVEPVAPEHVYMTMLELFRRRQRNAREDLRPKFRAQLIAAFEASGLTRQDYIARVQTNDEAATALLEEALAEHAEKLARQQALMALFDSSGKSPEEFADMYGMDRREVVRALARRQAA